MIETLVEIEHKEDFREQGFYSKTYLGYDRRLLRDVAIKDIDPQNFSSKEDFEKYFEEAQKLSLAAHPRVLPVYFVGIDHNHSLAGETGIPRIVTKYLANGSLNTLLEKVYSGRRTLSIEQCIRFTHDICQGMIHLHSLGILHLDLKASNVFIGDDNKAVIADFGQSRFLKQDILMRVDDIYPIINPPENIRDRGVDKTADIYQFGVLMYCIFNYDKYRTALDHKYQINTPALKKLFKENPDKETEEFAHFKENAKQLNKDIRAGLFPDRGDHHYYVPKEIREIINRCLEIDVSKRYNTFINIQSDLNDFIFPKEVTDLHVNLEDNSIVFMKNEKNSRILVLEEGDRYELTPHKGNQCKHTKIISNVTKNKFPKALFSLIDEL
jgi:eukaryotic-like serine/threonine-protein kinase